MTLIESEESLPEILSEDSSDQSKLLAHLEALRNDPQGWKTCIEALVNGKVKDAQRQFFCFQVMAFYLKEDYCSASQEDQNAIRSFMAFWLSRMASELEERDPTFIKNKVGQLFALAFVVDFPRRWPAWFDEIFLPHMDKVPLVEFYLRVLLGIDCEVADREIQRSKEEVERNTLIKDSIRELCVENLVTSWYEILKRFRETDFKITNLCLNVIGCYISWIEINLIANDKFVPHLVSCLQHSETQESACDCICSILSKGMDPTAKVQLIDAMDKVLVQSGFFTVSEDADPERIVKIGELVNCIGTMLVESWNKMVKAGQTQSASATVVPLIEAKCGLLLACLQHEDTDVSSSVVDFSHEYVLMLKQTGVGDENHQNFLKQLMVAVFRKYRYPDEYNHDKEGEDEAIFMDYRKEIKVIFMNMTMLDNELVLCAVEELVQRAVSNWRNTDYADVELALTLLYTVGEALQGSQGLQFSSNDSKSTRVRNMLKLVVTSEVSRQKHPVVSLQYFETVCRYDKMFSLEPALMMDVVASFLDDRGLHHESPRVRSRVSYLFSRFVKLHKSTLQVYVDRILSQLGDLLAVSPTTGSEQRLLSAEDQMFLFEATGTLIVVGNFSPEQKKQYMELLLGSLVTKFSEGLQALSDARDPEQIAVLVAFLNNVMAYASRTTKAFSNQQSMQSCLCSGLFLQLMATFLTSVTNENALLLDGLRQYLHRMVICLEMELLPHLGLIIQKFLSLAPDLKSLQSFIILIQQIISKHKDKAIPYLKDHTQILLETIWGTMGAPLDMTDETIARDLMYLKRAYFQILSSMVVNKCLDLWLFSGPNGVERILQSLVDGCLETSDPLTQKQCFSVISKALDLAKKGEYAWLEEFAWNRALIVSFQAPLTIGFDFTDAQTVLVVHEIGTILKKLHEINSEKLSQCVGKCFQELQLDDSISKQFGASLKTCDMKAFQKYLKGFLEELATRTKT